MIKKYFKAGALMACAAMLSLGFTACSDDDDDNNGNNGGNNTELSQNETQMRNIATQYLTNTVKLTYSQLATQTSNLYDQMKALDAKMKATPNEVTDDDIKNVCNTFIEARSLYEESEAFLYGAATDFGIDPHIDTWPLDPAGLSDQLSNPAVVNALDMTEGDEASEDAAIAYAAGKLGQENLGFHGIEFIIFRDGQPRTADALRGNETYKDFVGKNVTGREELIFATAVAGDLRDRCWQMEVAWDENAPQSHKDRVEALELPYTVNGGSNSYGQNMLLAGQAGSTYSSWAEVMTTIINSGCENIADEVANTKIGNPYSGEDPNYIESPYSHRSFIDFTDNLISIQNSLYGGREGSRNNSTSIIQYMKDHNYANEQALETSLSEAITALQNCQSQLGSFVGHINDPLVCEAQQKVIALDEQLTQAAEWFATQR